MVMENAKIKKFSALYENAKKSGHKVNGVKVKVDENVINNYFKEWKLAEEKLKIYEAKYKEFLKRQEKKKKKEPTEEVAKKPANEKKYEPYIHEESENDSDIDSD